MKILSASVKVIDDKNHVKILHEDEIEITIKSQAANPIEKIPEIKEEPPKKKSNKKSKKE